RHPAQEPGARPALPAGLPPDVGEFVALYPLRPKIGTVHLIVAPKRLIRRLDATAAEAPALARLAAYAAHLACQLAGRAGLQGLRFAAGLRLRQGGAEQLHAHVLSADLRAPGPGDLERRHFEDFTGGRARFLPLGLAAARLAAEGALPGGPPPGGPLAELACHLCGQRFAGAMHDSRATCTHARARAGPCAPRRAGDRVWRRWRRWASGAAGARRSPRRWRARAAAWSVHAPLAAVTTHLRR
ncbi:unnamed protein product, partial [Prorocentrum cordatum]